MFDSTWIEGVERRWCAGTHTGTTSLSVQMLRFNSLYFSFLPVFDSLSRVCSQFFQQCSFHPRFFLVFLFFLALYFSWHYNNIPRLDAKWEQRVCARNGPSRSMQVTVDCWSARDCCRANRIFGVWRYFVHWLSFSKSLLCSSSTDCCYRLFFWSGCLKQTRSKPNWMFVNTFVNMFENITEINWKMNQLVLFELINLYPWNLQRWCGMLKPNFPYRVWR